jgi:23S rRNA pseudouridine2605 synthase
MAMTRLHKWMATQGLTSRRMAERWILAGRVEVNGTVEKTLGRQIDPASDKIRVDGKLIQPEAPSLVYWLLNKPDAAITSRRDPEGRRTIYDLPSLSKQPFPVLTVGRLDYRTEGVLLLSNDGELVHRLMHPKYHVARTYDVLLPSRLRELQIDRLTKGIRLDDGPVAGVDIRACGSKNLGATRGSWYRLVVHEGRNRLVRRLFEKLGVRIIRLVRVAYGPIRLPEGLEPGGLIPLSPDQIAALKRATEIAPPLPVNKSLRRPRPSRANTSSNQNRYTKAAKPESVKAE